MALLYFNCHFLLTFSEKSAKISLQIRKEVNIMDANVFAAIFGALLVGALIGAIPAICGAIKHKIGLAIGGFFACLVSGLILE